MDGRTALVTGASRGIGLAIAQSLVDRGARVVVTARKPEVLAEAVASLGGPDVAIAVPGHAGDPDHRAAAVRTAVDTFGSLDMLVGNVGVNPVYGPMVDLDLDAFRKILDTNVVSSLGLVQQAWRAWMAEHGGSVLFVASVAGLRSSENIGAYGVSKAAVVNLTTQLAVELGPKVRVNAVAPAVVKTRFASALYEGREEEVAAGYPAGRLGVPEDIGEAAADATLAGGVAVRGVEVVAAVLIALLICPPLLILVVVVAVPLAAVAVLVSLVAGVLAVPYLLVRHLRGHRGPHAPLLVDRFRHAARALIDVLPHRIVLDARRIERRR
jgi:NAD(P)-dependent dehydrogenase (short-subunit alcohol dehydrogenase family)